MKLKLKDIRPNPYRDFKANPLVEEKVEALIDSINQTGFWDNVVVRLNEDEQPESAYGHHRIAAAIRAGLEEADFIIKKLSDAQMIQIMDNENRETYGATLQTLIESVKAVVNALAQGKIPAFKVDPDTPKSKLRYAPSFVAGKEPSGSGPERAYTAYNIAVFLGRVTGGDADRSILAALHALHLKETGSFSDSLFYTKDRTGAKKPATIKEFVKIAGDLTRQEKARETSMREVREAEQKAIDEKRAIEREAKARAKEAEAKEADLREKALAAKKEEDTRKIERTKQRIKDLAEREKEKEVIDKIKMAAIDQKVAKVKQAAAEAAKEQEYMPNLRKRDALLVRINAPESFQEEVKAYFRIQSLRPEDRELVRQALMSRGERSFDLSRHGLPPLNARQWSKLYAEREAQKRKEEERAAEKAESKKEKKKR